MTPSNNVVEYQRFGGPYCFSLQSKDGGSITPHPETLVTYHMTARCHNPEDRDFNLHGCGNRISRSISTLIK